MKYCDYLDKVRACWMGKNIGGTLGAPFECKRGAFDLTFYTHDVEKEGILPNDDLDLQLVWLNAAEKYGTNVDAEILSTYWLTGVDAYWSEYAAGMNNMSFGILPPSSGAHENPFGESCGCFIRSEIWACLAPGHPEIAVKYAYEDAIIDHNKDGVWAEVFCAALQSAAFVESDPDKLIDIALSYIPEECGIKTAIDVVRNAYKEGVDWKEARKRVLNTVPCTFGVRYENNEPELKVGALGYDAPANIGLMILGWIYGENDFSKSICIAAGCGEDADCTAGTLGATFGIINGTKSIDKKWTDPIGDEIKTVACNRASTFVSIPGNINDLTKRVSKAMLAFMKENIELSEDGVMELIPSDEMKQKIWFSGWLERTPECWYVNETNVIAKSANSIFDIYVCADDLYFEENSKKELKIRYVNKTGRLLWSNIKLSFKNDIGEIKEINYSFRPNEYTLGSSISEKTILVPVGEHINDRLDAELVISANEYPSKIYIPLVFIKK